MARFRAHGVPSLVAAASAIALAIAACAPATPAATPAETATTLAPTQVPGPTATPGGGPPIATPFTGMLVTTSTVDPITWYGERCDPLSPEWLVTGSTTAEGYDELWSYRATIDPATMQGSYEYEAKGEIAGGSLIKTGTGPASVLEADGTWVLKVEDISVTGTITAGGTTQTVTLPVPGTEFVFQPAEREDCP